MGAGEHRKGTGTIVELAGTTTEGSLQAQQHTVASTGSMELPKARARQSPQARRKGCRTEQTDAQAAMRARRQLEADVEAGAGRPADRIHRSSPGRHGLTGAPLPRRSGGKGHGDSVLGMGLPPTLPGQLRKRTLTF